MLQELLIAAADVPTPPVGKKIVFFDLSNFGAFSEKDSAGNVAVIGSAALGLDGVLAIGNSAGGLGITNLLDPSGAQDAATKNYIDSNFVPQARELTINGVTYDLTADRTWVVTGGGYTVISANETAANDTNYTVIANATFTDPSPVAGKGFVVFVRNGTATIGGTGYGVGNLVFRVFHSGSWANYAFVDQTIIGSATQAALNGKENSLGFTPENVANKATTFGTINDTLYPSTKAVNDRYECEQRTGTSIAFDRPANYGTIASPETGNITGDYTGARIGIVQLIIHNHSSVPTIPATWEKANTSGNYTTGVVNYIAVFWLSSDIAVYTIWQDV
jgi:hypothetical protein